MCRGLNVKNTYLEACGDGGNVVVGGTKIGFIDLRWSETKLRERVGGRNASKNAAERFDPKALLSGDMLGEPFVLRLSQGNDLKNSYRCKQLL